VLLGVGALFPGTDDRCAHYYRAVLRRRAFIDTLIETENIKRITIEELELCRIVRYSNKTEKKYQF